jgi:hypothetical protein
VTHELHIEPHSDASHIGRCTCRTWSLIGPTDLIQQYHLLHLLDEIRTKVNQLHEARGYDPSPLQAALSALGNRLNDAERATWRVVPQDHGPPRLERIPKDTP